MFCWKIHLGVTWFLSVCSLFQSAQHEVVLVGFVPSGAQASGSAHCQFKDPLYILLYPLGSNLISSDTFCR